MPPKAGNQKPVEQKKVKGVSRSVSLDSPFEPMGYDSSIVLTIFGHPGTGKTHFWGTFPKPIAVLLSSTGNKSGELRTLDREEYRGKIDMLKVDNVSKMETALDYLYANTGKYKTVVLDHVTGFQDTVICEIVGLEEIPEQKSWGIATQENWGQCTLQCKTLLSRLIELPNTNIVMIGQERNFGDSESSVSDQIFPTITVAATKSMAGWVCYKSDFVVQTFKKKRTKIVKSIIQKKEVTTEVEVKDSSGQCLIDFCLRVAPHEIINTKMRGDSLRTKNLPSIIIDPTYDKIAQYLK